MNSFTNMAAAMPSRNAVVQPEAPAPRRMRRLHAGRRPISSALLSHFA